MKTTGFGLLVIATLFMFNAFLPAAASGISDEDSRQVIKPTPTEVYYFHLTRRCVTCQTVEEVSEQTVKELFPEAVKSGLLSFKSVNVEDKANKALMKKLRISGQSLLIVNGSERIDITDKGFMYAVNDPNKLKAEIKSHLEKFIK